jgi:hypothetical protein
LSVTSTILRVVHFHHRNVLGILDLDCPWGCRVSSECWCLLVMWNGPIISMLPGIISEYFAPTYIIRSFPVVSHAGIHLTFLWCLASWHARLRRTPIMRLKSCSNFPAEATPIVAPSLQNTSRRYERNVAPRSFPPSESSREHYPIPARSFYQSPVAYPYTNRY